MKKIKVKILTKGCAPIINKKGDWIDLRSAEDVTLEAPYAGQLNRPEHKYRSVIFDEHLIPLGVAMELPEGYEAHIVARSSTFKNFGIILSNGKGIVDSVYNGDNDQWFAPVIALRDTKINKGDRICQFRIMLSQKATVWQRIKDVFSGGVKLEFVDYLGNPDRSGHGSTGIS